MKKWRYALLLSELLLFAMILVLPQVDLPDFTFPGGSAPIAAKSRLCSPPAVSVPPAPVATGSLGHIGEGTILEIPAAVQMSPSLVNLTCVLRC
jgi:hypothetical protein